MYFARGKKMGITLFSAVTITSRLDSTPLAGGLFISESEEAAIPDGIPSSFGKSPVHRV